MAIAKMPLHRFSHLVARQLSPAQHGILQVITSSHNYYRKLPDLKKKSRAPTEFWCESQLPIHEDHLWRNISGPDNCHMYDVDWKKFNSSILGRIRASNFRI